MRLMLKCRRVLSLVKVDYRLKLSRYRDRYRYRYRYR